MGTDMANRNDSVPAVPHDAADRRKVERSLAQVRAQT
jgi:hypothetical protein